jgi:hypothetical protein
MRAGFLLALLFGAGWYAWTAFTGLSYLSSAGRLGPGFFPRIIGAGLVVLLAYSLFADLRRRHTEDAVSPHWRTAAVLALLCAVFVGLLDLIGGLLAMVAFMAGSLWFLNRGRALQSALVAVLLPLAVYVVFSVWLNATLPRGLIPLPF